jgi:hypothetical protein
MAARSPFGRTEEVEENAEHETSDSRDEGYRGGPPHGDKDFKPVHLKGLFRCVWLVHIETTCVLNDICVKQRIDDVNEASFGSQGGHQEGALTSPFFPLPLLPLSSSGYLASEKSFQVIEYMYKSSVKCFSLGSGPCSSRCEYSSYPDLQKVVRNFNPIARPIAKIEGIIPSIYIYIH